MTQHGERYIVGPVVGAFDALEFVLASARPVSLGEISRGCDRNKTTVYRYVQTLLFLGYLQVTECGTYEIGPAIHALQNDDARDRTIRAVAEPVMHALNGTLRETVNLGVPKGRRVYYLAILSGPEDCGGIAQVGDGDYFHCTALGKAILAFQIPEIRAAHLRPELLRLTDHTILDKRRLFAELSEVRRRGYAIDRGENEAGYSCFGVPVRDWRGLPVAAISVSLRTDRVTRSREFEVSESVMLAAREIEARLARRRGSAGQRAGGDRA
ncbi:MAG TPA: IclR family transcriptional regulator [Acetobacteraceae bacterium]|nr:IclR family transcriptional regulator [Acetobacteraceae bacterium]